MTWHIITGEYPPVIGGVSDYSQLIAEGLAEAGDDVHVWCPTTSDLAPPSGVTLHPELGRIARRDLRRVDRLLDQFASPRRLLVQWVPHGFGLRSMNVPFCLWLHRRARGGDRVELMVHEPYLEFGAGRAYHALTAVTHRFMTMVLLNASSHIWIAIPAWERYLRPYLFGRRVPFTWLPIPTGVKPRPLAEIAPIRARYAREGGLVGHFGTFSPAISRLLGERLPGVLNGVPAPAVLLAGTGSETFRAQLVGAHPELSDRVHALGFVSSSKLGAYLAACDLCVQPYPDGISSRRTTAMACLSLGIPIVTTSGHLTEPLWRESDAVSLADVADTVTFVREVWRLLGDQRARRGLGERARAFYELHFSAARVVEALRDVPNRTYPAASAAIA